MCERQRATSFSRVCRSGQNDADQPQKRTRWKNQNGAAGQVDHEQRERKKKRGDRDHSEAGVKQTLIEPRLIFESVSLNSVTRFEFASHGGRR